MYTVILIGNNRTPAHRPDCPAHARNSQQRVVSYTHDLRVHHARHPNGYARRRLYRTNCDAMRTALEAQWTCVKPGLSRRDSPLTTQSQSACVSPLRCRAAVPFLGPHTRPAKLSQSSGSRIVSYPVQHSRRHATWTRAHLPLARPQARASSTLARRPRQAEAAAVGRAVGALVHRRVAPACRAGFLSALLINCR